MGKNINAIINIKLTSKVYRILGAHNTVIIVIKKKPWGCSTCNNRMYALFSHSEQLKTCPSLDFGQINSDSLNRVSFKKSRNGQMFMNHDQGVKPVTMCLICLRPSNMVSDSIITLLWLIERIRSILFLKLSLRGRGARRGESAVSLKM